MTMVCYHQITSMWYAFLSGKVVGHYTRNLGVRSSGPAHASISWNCLQPFFSFLPASVNIIEMRALLEKPKLKLTCPLLSFDSI